ncbi:MAG: TIGR03745 family integrating conjugative element membrane protein [Gammaproteobacteria bacterium]|nr:TIGR03745 family integrating conjugative element membrane protein [Gammaproteobacteria bacterium]
MNVVKEGAGYLQNVWARLMVLVLMGLAGPVSAALPSIDEPGRTPGGGTGFFNKFLGYLWDGLYWGGMALGAIVLAAVAWSCLGKFNEARKGKAEWSEVGIVVVVGAAIVVADIWLLTEMQATLA